MTELDELRRLAEAASEWLQLPESTAMIIFQEACTPELILSLLDQIQESRRDGFNEGIDAAMKVMRAHPRFYERYEQSIAEEIRKLKQD